MVLTRKDVEALLVNMIAFNKNAIVDWTNQRIMVLSEEKPLMKNGERVILSDGPANYRDYLYTIEDTLDLAEQRIANSLRSDDQP